MKGNVSVTVTVQTVHRLQVYLVGSPILGVLINRLVDEVFKVVESTS